jgi:hypothetical protein
LELITNLIQQFDHENPNFRPTEIYNENWLLKAFLSQLSEVNIPKSSISFSKGAHWYSEAMLPTAFQAKYRGDKLAESRTNADGVIGHFTIGETGKADLKLNNNATQFVVVEAKIDSRLSSGVTHAKNFDQAARSIACMAEVLRRGKIHPSNLDKLAFIVLAPQAKIESGTFDVELEKDGLSQKIEDRVSMYKERAEYEEEYENWLEKWAKPTLEEISIQAISWEDAIRRINNEEPNEAATLKEFYERCLKYN